MRVSTKDAARRRRSSRGFRFRRRLLIAVALPAVALGLSLAFLGAIAGLHGWRSAWIDIAAAGSPDASLRAVLKGPGNLLRALSSDVRAPRLSLDIKFKHLRKIQERRDEVLRNGVPATSEGDLVPASIDLTERSVPVRVRLAHARAEQLKGEKWPLRVHVKGEDHVFGMRRFTLQSPSLRGFEAEGLFLEQLRREDVLAPRYFFVHVTLNGKDIGLMAIEESFSKELLENQERRDGVILRLAAPAEVGRGGDGGCPSAAAPAGGVQIVPFRAARIAGSKRLSRDLVTASALLRGFLDEALAPDQVFDVELSGRFLAVAEVWRASEALCWENLRFYYNPLTARLEPIGHASGLQHATVGEAPIPRNMPFARRLLASPAIHAHFVGALRRIAGELVGRTTFEAIAEQEQRQLRLLHGEYPFHVPFDLAALRRRAASLRAVDAAEPAPKAEEGRGAPRPTRSNHTPPIPEATLEEVLAHHPFLGWDATAQQLRAEPGRWEVRGSLVLPERVGLELPAGTVLHFESGQGLIARGPLTFLGEEDAPVVLEGPPGSKRSELWSGVFLMESDRPSHWSHVVVRNTGGFKTRNWTLAGGVVFRETHVDLDHCSFMGSRSDDALNIVRSTFSLTDVTILDAKSDALDVDFAEGSVEGGVISGAAGDGIDAGGSRVAVRGTRLTQIRDKAISVGERSRVSATGVVIERAGIGLASKNGAEAEIEKSTLGDIVDVAFIAYMNRPEFGPGKLTADQNRITGATRTALAQVGSQVVLDGSVIAPEDFAFDLLHRGTDPEP